jgi:AraC family transcriptional regulator, melibiose operon regulatory protein
LTCKRQTALPPKCGSYHTHIEINLIQRGAATYLSGGNRIRVGPGRLVAFWAAIPHQIVEATGDAQYFAMTIPLTWFLRCQLPEGFTRPILEGQVVVDAEACSPLDFATFERWSHDLQTCHPACQRVVLLEVEARLLRLTASVAPPTSTASTERSVSGLRSGDNVDRIRRMLCFIAHNYTEQITVELISRSVGFHPNYAMHLFRKIFGTTLVHYVTRQRVSHAQRLLATGEQKIVDVALSSGFNSLSRFNEAFKRACGCSPRAYRERSRQLQFN